MTFVTVKPLRLAVTVGGSAVKPVKCMMTWARPPGKRANVGASSFKSGVSAGGFTITGSIVCVEPSGTVKTAG